MIGVLLGDGHGQFAAPAVFATGGVVIYGFAPGDFNGDGRTDLAAFTYAGTVALLTNIYGPPPVTLDSADGTSFDVAAGTFGAGEIVQGTNNAFDGDGRLLVGGKPFHPPSSTRPSGRRRLHPWSRATARSPA